MIATTLASRAADAYSRIRIPAVEATIANGRASTAELAVKPSVGPDAFLRQLRTLRVMRTLRVLKLLKLAAEQAQKSAAGAAQRRNTFAADVQIYAICLFTVVSISSSLIHLAEGVAPGVPETTSEMFAALKDAEEGKTTEPEWANDPMVAIYQERSAKGWSTPVYTFTSVPKAYWWSFVTLTTTGYGDMFPVTGFGRIVGGLTMLAGLALFSLLTSVVEMHIVYHQTFTLVPSHS